MVETNQLLQEFAQKGSEEAFRELVKRYVDLVYSVARRRLGGDAHLAEDVAQTVFVDFARQARQSQAPWLQGSCPVAGWLHRHTCFVSANMVRSSRRRQIREQAAVEMNLHNSSETQDLAPELDEAVHQLHPEDRDAILLRFYDQRDLRTVGNALGISEDAAQKRVGRAIDKLRTILVQRGVSLSTVALGAFLGENAVQSAPTGLSDRLVDAALAGGVSGVALLASLLKFATSVKGALILGSAAVALLMLPMALTRGGNENATSNEIHPGIVAISTSNPNASASNEAASPTSLAQADTTASSETNGLHLRILAKESDKPVPGVEVNYRAWLKDRFLGRKTFRTNRSGESVVQIEPGLTWLELITHSDGFADTCLQWRQDRGEMIPPQYTVRLSRAVPIGGRVVDSEGHPVAGAKVGFNTEQDPIDERRPESHDFKWIEVETDSDGRWRIDRMAEEVISRIYGGAQHPDHIRSAMVFVAKDAQAEAQLRAEQYVFTLGQALAVRGLVVDANEQPIPGAKLTVGSIGNPDRPKTTTGANGTFILRGCEPGANTLTASCEGYAPTSLSVDVSAESQPVRIVLKAGKTLRLRVVDKDGAPVPQVNLWFDAFERGIPGQNAPAPQVDFSPKTDAEGLAIWTNAPDQELSFHASKTGYMRVSDFKVRPDDQEHQLLLPPALVIEGTVKDVDSGEPIPKFRVICGAPGGSLQDNQPLWSTLERFWPSFAGGVFRHSLEEQVIVHSTHQGYYFKFEADGYAPVVTRRIAPDEGVVHLNVKLEKGQATMVTVLRPDGSPAPRMDVALVLLGTKVELTQTGFSRDGSSGGTLLRTDEAGQFKLAANPTLQRVVAASSDGYGEATPAALTTQPILRMAPWGGVHGVVWRRRQPVASANIILESLSNSFTGLVFERNSFKTTSDANGDFSFLHVPPGRHRLIRLEPMQGGNTHMPLGEVEVRAGEVTEVDYGKTGCTVIARLPWPATVPRQPDLRLVGEMATPMPNPPAEIRGNSQAIAQWMKDPAVSAALAAARTNFRSWPLTLMDDGSWSSEPLPPGQYVLHVYVADASTPPRADSLRAHTQLEITVPENTADLDLGEVTW